MAAKANSLAARIARLAARKPGARVVNRVTAKDSKAVDRLAAEIGNSR